MKSNVSFYLPLINIGAFLKIPLQTSVPTLLSVSVSWYYITDTSSLVCPSAGCCASNFRNRLWTEYGTGYTLPALKTSYIPNHRPRPRASALCCLCAAGILFTRRARLRSHSGITILSLPDGIRHFLPSLFSWLSLSTSLAVMLLYWAKLPICSQPTIDYIPRSFG